MRKIHLILFVISILFFSCKSDMKNIYSKRIEVLQNFENITIERRGKGVSISFYKDSLLNDYTFMENNSLFTKDTLAFINDTIQFDLKELNKSYLIKKNGVEDYLQYYLKKMKEYKIRSIDSNFKKFGITLEINLKNCQVLYISDVTAIKNSQWIEFVKKSHKLDENWYWRKY